MLALYRELYDIEDRGRNVSAADRLALRQNEARGVWERLQTLLDGGDAFYEEIFSALTVPYPPVVWAAEKLSSIQRRSL